MASRGQVELPGEPDYWRGFSMSATAEYTIGAPAYCEDGACGEVARVVLDPIERAITHLVVQKRHGYDLGRLVPIGLVKTSTQQELRLNCTRAQFETLEEAKETELIPGPGDPWGYGPNQMLMMPLFGLRGVGTGIGGVGPGIGPLPQTVAHTYDKVPPGEVEVRRGQHVHATDGPIGRTRGLVVDPSDHKVTHVLLDEGHLWGKKEVSIPITAVTGVDDDGVRLSLTKAEVADLPRVDLDERDGASGDQ